MPHHLGTFNQEFPRFADGVIVGFGTEGYTLAMRRMGTLLA